MLLSWMFSAAAEHIFNTIWILITLVLAHCVCMCIYLQAMWNHHLSFPGNKRPCAHFLPSWNLAAVQTCIFLCQLSATPAKDSYIAQQLIYALPTSPLWIHSLPWLLPCALEMPEHPVSLEWTILMDHCPQTSSKDPEQSDLRGSFWIWVALALLSGWSKICTKYWRKGQC